MRYLKSVIIGIIALFLVCCIPSEVVYAEDLDSHTDNIVLASGTYYNIYTDIQTKIYTGNRTEKWLHIRSDKSNVFILTMIDYNGGTVWDKPFNSNGTTHWYIGSNVRYVYLIGSKPDRVYVTVTNN